MSILNRSPFIQTGQSHENDQAQIVIVCAPSSLSKLMGSLHPAGALYEKPVNIRNARESHAAFVSLLKRHNIDVRDVRDILTDRVDYSVGDRIDLENLAFSCLTYVYDSDGSDVEDDNCFQSGVTKKTTYSEAHQYYVSDQYKRTVIEEMGQQQLVDIIFTNPTVTVTPSQRDTGFKASYSFYPLSNIVFVRDQQITTRKGIVMARLKSTQRQREVDIMQFCFNKLGLNVVGRVPSPGYLEGGDFFPAGPQLSLLGIGPRSDWHAAKYLLQQDLFGTDLVAIVKDELERTQERMHLDTVFNILNSECCLMLADMIGENSPTKRVVDEYVHCSSPLAEGIDNSNAIGNYVVRQRDVEFSKYMKDKGYDIISVPGKEQLNYGCNALNLGNGYIISIEKNTARLISRAACFSGTVEYLDFSAVTSMYGGVHCASQVVLRKKGEGSKLDPNMLEPCFKTEGAGLAERNGLSIDE